MKIKSDIYNIEICPCTDKKNDERRLFFTKKKAELISTNEQLRNMADILTVKDVIVYEIDVDDWEKRMYANKTVSDDRFIDLMEKLKSAAREGIYFSFKSYFG